MSLFGGTIYGNHLYGSPLLSPAGISGDLVVFENYSLSDGESVLCTYLRDSGPSRELIGGNIPRLDGQFLTSSYHREKIIEVRGVIYASTVADLNTLLDTVRKSLRKQEGNLDITRDGSTRRYIATLVNYDELFAERQGYHITFCPFVARFSCKVPFGADIDYTNTELTIATSPTNQDMQNLGTITAEPVIYLVFDSATGVTAVNLKNLTTGEEIQYNGSLAMGDVLKIDSENKELLLNGAQKSYSGSFPTLDVGGNLLQFTVTGTSFSTTATLKHKSRYL